MHALQGPLSKNLALSRGPFHEGCFLSLLYPSQEPSPSPCVSTLRFLPRASPRRCCFDTPGSYLHKTLNEWEVRQGVERFIHEHYALGLMTISHYTYCPCNCHKRLRNIKANYLIAGRCASLFPLPAPMFFGNTFKGKKKYPWRHYVREAHGSRSGCPRTPKGQTTRAQGTNNQGMAQQRTGPAPSLYQQGTGGCSQPLPPKPHATSTMPAPALPHPTATKETRMKVCLANRAQV